MSRRKRHAVSSRAGQRPETASAASGRPREILLDTHVLIWASLAPEKLSARVREMLESGDYQILVSAASCWEMAVKTQKGKWKFQDPTALALEWAESLDARWIVIEPYDVLVLETIPMLHADPFDRMLLAQAARGSMPLITKDEDLHRYAEEKISPAPGLPGQRPELVW